MKRATCVIMIAQLLAVCKNNDMSNETRNSLQNIIFMIVGITKIVTRKNNGERRENKKK